MRRSEWIGLGIALFVLLLTYSLGTLHSILKDFLQTKIAKASEVEIEKPEEKIFKPLNVFTSKKSYYRYELVEILADYRDYEKKPIVSGNLSAKIYFNNKLITTVGNISEIQLYYDSNLKLWRGRFPVPWNPQLGEYSALVIAKPADPGPVLKETCNFSIIGKEPPQIPSGLAVMAVENYSDLNKRKLQGPDGSMGDWKKILDWAQYCGADAVFCLAGMTDGEVRYDKERKIKVFRPDLLELTKKLSFEAKNRGFLYGAWVMSFMMQKKDADKFGYTPSISYNKMNDTLYPSYHISIGDKKRLDDLVEIVKELDKNPYVDFIGLDYIRTGDFDGYELVDEVVSEMSIPVPVEWDRMGPRERIIWFAKKISSENDESVIEKWRWWRAHKVAMNVKEIIERSGTKKPIWLFTLGWEHGKQHGQDPLMFNDAGITYDAVMLYEANQKQFRQVLVDWKNYLKTRQVNIICGNSVDVTLLDSPVLTPPEEIVRRNVTGVKQLLFGGLTDGLFWHDLTRALWGRKGEFSTKEWVITAGTSFSRFREEKGISPLSLRVQTENSVAVGTPFKVVAVIENISLDAIKNIKVELERVEGLVCKNNKVVIEELNPGEKIECVFDCSFFLERFRNFGMVPVKIIFENNKPSFNFQIVRLIRKNSEPIVAKPSEVEKNVIDEGVIKLKDDENENINSSEN